MDENSRIFVMGNRGLVGSVIVRALRTTGRTNIIVRSWTETDPENQGAVVNLFLGSSCIYPKLAPQSIKEEYLLRGHQGGVDIGHGDAAAGIPACRRHCRGVPALHRALRRRRDHLQVVPGQPGQHPVLMGSANRRIARGESRSATPEGRR